MITFGPPPPRRRPSLTPMIDVVFLLLVFFMLASRFGGEAHLPLQGAGSGAQAAYSGPPRVVDIGPGTLRLNGQSMEQDALVPALAALMDGPDDTIILRADASVAAARLAALLPRLGDLGFARIELVTVTR